MLAETITAICAQVLAHHDLAAGDPQRAGERTAHFVYQVLGRQPPWVRVPVQLLTLAFGVGPLLFAGRRFAGLSPSRRRRWFGLWADSAFFPCAALVRFYASLVLLEAVDPRRLNGDDDSPRCARLPAVRRPPARADIVVIGSGPGGAVTAELLATAGREVVVIEEGTVGPEGRTIPFSPHEMLEYARHGGVSLAYGRPPIAYMEGRCIGGGSEINSGFYHRTPAAVLAQWERAFGLRGATAEALDDHFAACEGALDIALFSGPPPAASQRLAAGAAALGWRAIRVPKWRSYARNGPWEDGSRGPYHSMSRTYLPRFLAAGGQLVAGVRAQRVVREGRSWRVDGVCEAGASFIRADHVFVAAGAVHTPALLRRSGFRRHVGDSLAVQPTIKVIAEFTERVNSPVLGIGEHQVTEFTPDMTFACATSSPAQLALGLSRYPGAMARFTTDWECMAMYAVMLAGRGRGSVRNIPGAADPLVSYRLARDDWQALAIGLKRLGRLLFAAGAVRLYPVLDLSEPLADLAALDRLPDDLSRLRPQLVTVHLTSSCPMGERPARCATDSYGAVHGVTGLHVADASLLCTAPGVNPQGSIMAFARRNAAHFLRP